MDAIEERGGPASRQANPFTAAQAAPGQSLQDLSGQLAQAALDMRANARQVADTLLQARQLLGKRPPALLDTGLADKLGEARARAGRIYTLSLEAIEPTGDPAATARRQAMALATVRADAQAVSAGLDELRDSVQTVQRKDRQVEQQFAEMEKMLAGLSAILEALTQAAGMHVDASAKLGLLLGGVESSPGGTR